MIGPSTQSWSTTNNFCVTTTTTMATTATVTAKAKKTKTPPPPRGQKRKDTSTSTKKRTTNKNATNNNNKKKQKKTLTIKQVNNARNKVVLNLEKNLKPKAKGKRASFSKEEDRMLTKAYVNVSLNPKVGCNRKGEVYWNQVKEKFDGTSYRHWPSTSIQAQFSKKIAPECTVFLFFFKKAKAVKQSGWSIEQYIEAANILFIEQHERSFKFKKCMAILVDLPRYSIDPIVDDKKVEDGHMVVGGTNPIMAILRCDTKQQL